MLSSEETGDEGLGVQSLRYNIPVMKHQRTCQLATSDNRRVHLTYELEDLASPVVAGRIVSTKADIANIWREKLESWVDGTGQENLRGS